MNTFDNTEDALVTYNDASSNSLWEKGTPSGTLLNSASSGSEAYATNLNGEHPTIQKPF